MHKNLVRLHFAAAFYVREKNLRYLIILGKLLLYRMCSCVKLT